MAHGDTVVHTDGVKDERDTASLTHAFLHIVADFLKVDVAWNDVDVAITNCDKRFVPIIFTHAGGPQKAPVSGSLVALFDGVGTHEGFAVRLGRHRFLNPGSGELVWV